MEETESSNMINKTSYLKTNLYSDHLSEKPKKPGSKQNRASVKVNSDSTQPNAQQNKLMMLKQHEEMIKIKTKTSDNEKE